MPNGSLNGTLTTCGTTRVLTCDPCYDMDGDGVALCGEDETWAFESNCIIKGIVVYYTLWQSFMQHTVYKVIFAVLLQMIFFLNHTIPFSVLLNFISAFYL